MLRKPFLSFSLICLSLVVAAQTALADTIRLKDGTVIRGEVTGFRDQQFIVLIGSGERGRRSQVTVYIEDVESIEFDRPTNVSAANSNQTSTGNNNNNDQTGARRDTDVGTVTRPGGNNDTSAGSNRNNTGRDNNNAAANNSPSNNTGNRNTTGGASTNNTGTFYPTNVQVRADNTANGWADSGVLITRGQRIRISATGRVSLGGGKFSTPSGLLAVTDRDKLMRDRPTGSLIAVIGDDNDEFIYVGAQREFTAQRDGRLFLGVNEGNLNDNSGSYDVVIEAEAVSRGGNR